MIWNGMEKKFQGMKLGMFERSKIHVFAIRSQRKIWQRAFGDMLVSQIWKLLPFLSVCWLSYWHKYSICKSRNFTDFLKLFLLSETLMFNIPMSLITMIAVTFTFLFLIKKGETIGGHLLTEISSTPRQKSQFWKLLTECLSENLIAPQMAVDILNSKYFMTIDENFWLKSQYFGMLVCLLSHNVLLNKREPPIISLTELHVVNREIVIEVCQIHSRISQGTNFYK